MLRPRLVALRAPFTVAFLAAVLVNNALAKPAVEKQEIWDPNYCNDTKIQETASLTKTALGQFLGYQCDAIFFHCRWGVDGWRTYKKTCRMGLVYDTTGTQNCNYDFNVDGCGMKQCADCLGDQYACCLSEECVDLGMRCDGKYDCTLEEDEQNCPTCGAAQFPCVLSEECVEFDKRCNGIKECTDGTDEQHCEECAAGNFYCRNSKRCIELKLRCDGKRDCDMGEDEAFCGGIHEDQKEYTCTDQVHTIAKQDVCNGVDDCPDGSDEQYCISGNPDEEPSAAVSPFHVAKVGGSKNSNATKINHATNGRITGAAAPAFEEEEEEEPREEPELEEPAVQTGGTTPEEPIDEDEEEPLVTPTRPPTRPHTVAAPIPTAQSAPPTVRPSPTAPPAPQSSTRRFLIPSTIRSAASSPNHPPLHIPTTPPSPQPTVQSRGPVVGRHLGGNPASTSQAPVIIDRHLGSSQSSIQQTTATTPRRPKAPPSPIVTTTQLNEEDYFYEEKSIT